MQKEELVALLADCEMVDTTSHYTPWSQYIGGRRSTWHMSQEGRQVTGWRDYLLRMDKHNFYNARVKEAQIHTYHWMVLEVLRGE